MSRQVRLRRGTTAQHAAFTGLEGEVTVDTTLDTLRVHDGATAGGRQLARADGSNASGTWPISISGSVATANALTTARNIALGGAITGSASFNGSADITITASINFSTLPQSITISESGAIAANSLGFRGLPQNAQTSAYSLALADAGKHISITTGGVTIPANASVAFPIGTTIVVFNNSGSSQSIAITSDTLRLAGGALTGTRTLAQYGLATLVKVSATVWVISGAGVS